MHQENKYPKYPMWNPKTITVLLLFVFAISAGLVFILGHRSVFVELQITLAIISLCLFFLLTFGLYKGVRIQKEKFKETKFEILEPGSLPGSVDLTSPKDWEFPDTGDDLVGIIISIVLWILVTLILFIVLFFLANLIWAVIFAHGVIVYWVFYRALRQVFMKSRICKGNLLKSIKYSIFYTVLYTGWIYFIIWVSRFLMSRA